MIQMHYFGEMITNTDMHWGNLSFFLTDTPPVVLAPVYDMLPMLFRPTSTGEIVERRFATKLPKPEDRAAWLSMYPHAMRYWQQVQQNSHISPVFQQIAIAAITNLQRIHDILPSP